MAEGLERYKITNKKKGLILKVDLSETPDENGVIYHIIEEHDQGYTCYEQHDKAIDPTQPANTVFIKKDYVMGSSTYKPRDKKWKRKQQSQEELEAIVAKENKAKEEAAVKLHNKKIEASRNLNDKQKEIKKITVRGEDQ